MGVERKHRQIVEQGLNLLSQAHMPLKYWWFAFQIAAYLTNILPSPILSNLCPFQILFHKVPNYFVIKVLVVQFTPS